MDAWQRSEQQLNMLGISVQRDASLAPLTSFHIGGPAALLIEPTDEEQLIRTVRTLRENGVFYLLLGRGSNVLLPDEGIRGAIVRTTAMRGVTVGEMTIDARCGATLGEIARAAQRAALTGMEFAYGIPGTLGGALCMNAGAYGGEMAQVVRAVRLYDADRNTVLALTGEQMEFGYRKSILQRTSEYIALGATLALTKDDVTAIEARMQDYMQRRRQKQPLEYPSAGSVFKRPEGAFAGQLIEASGLKGYSIGGAMVSPKHAGFIVNTGGATARDVLLLIEHIRQVVLRDHGIELVPEVQILTAHMARDER